MRLDIYIDDCCETCEQARKIADQDGVTLFLGNPNEAELFERLATQGS